MKIACLLPLLMFLHPVFSQNREINFEHENLPGIIARAKAASKLVFVDCYTEWCGPCKQMSKHVFTIDSIADFFNSRFINLKLDMEKGEGPEAGKKYKVGAYPSFLIFDGEGTLLYKFVGGMEAAEFMKKIRTGIDPDNEIAKIWRRYNAGDRSHQLMRDYIWESLKMLERKPAQELALEYFNLLTPAERTAKENWFLFGENHYSRELSDMNSHNFNYLVDNWKAFAAVQGKEVVDQKIAGVFRKMTGYCLRGYYQKTFGYNKEDFARYRRQIKRTRVPDKADLMVMMDIAEAACKTDSGRVVDLLADNVGKFKSENIDIVFDFLWFIPPHKRKEFPRWMEVIKEAAAHSNNPNLVKHAKTYL